MKKLTTVLTAVIATAGLFFGCNGKSSKADNSLSELKGRGVFVLGLDDSFPPLGFRDENNEITGYDIDLAKEVSKRLGVTFKAQPINWDAKEQELSTGNIDCIWNGLTITEERKAILSFTKPYLSTYVTINSSPLNSLITFPIGVFGFAISKISFLNFTTCPIFIFNNSLFIIFIFHSLYIFFAFFTI